MTNKETLNEKILALRTAVLSNLLRKKKIKHSVSDLEKMVINKSELSVYNYFSSKKKCKEKNYYLLDINHNCLNSFIYYLHILAFNKFEGFNY